MQGLQRLSVFNITVLLHPLVPRLYQGQVKLFQLPTALLASEVFTLLSTIYVGYERQMSLAHRAPPVALATRLGMTKHVTVGNTRLFL
jgi:hypothetical protein